LNGKPDFSGVWEAERPRVDAHRSYTGQATPDPDNLQIDQTDDATVLNSPQLMNLWDREVGAMRERISRCLRQTFQEHGLVVFDMQLTERPPGLTDDVRDFWGGYLVEFKISTPHDFASSR
jgi:hypothetical protein